MTPRPLVLALLLFATSTPSAPPAGLPERDVTCARDDDCGLDWTYLVEGKCCDGTCSPQPASKRHLEAVAQQCKSLRFATDCPVKKCAPPPTLRCVAKRCVFVR